MRPNFLTPLGMAACLALLPSVARANINELFADLFGRPREAKVRAGYEARQWKERTDSAGGLSYQRQQLFDLSIPVATSETERWKIDLAGRLDEVKGKIGFANGRLVPNRLWDLGLGFSHSRRLEGDRALAFSVLVGSNGDQPFRRGRDTVAQGNLIYKVPAAGPEASWLFLLNFSNTRNFANYIPIPGVAYFFRPTETLRLALGVPFFTALWNPTPKSILNVSYFPLNNVQARFSYFFFGPAQGYAQVRYQSKNYLTSDRTDIRERLFYEEAILQVGVTSPVSKDLAFDLYAGRAFDRKFFQGKRTLDKSRTEVLRPAAGPFAALRLIASF
ncbi:MAG: hypothetical protein EOP11_10615 [Proteobacteria bacterium]|nr:MAG: hypothetical protein EOP11_10615 [Pseudomonadota bacterium]